MSAITEGVVVAPKSFSAQIGNFNALIGESIHSRTICGIASTVIGALASSYFGPVNGLLTAGVSYLLTEMVRKDEQRSVVDRYCVKAKEEIANAQAELDRIPRLEALYQAQVKQMSSLQAENIALTMKVENLTQLLEQDTVPSLSAVDIATNQVYADTLEPGSVRVESDKEVESRKGSTASETAHSPGGPLPDSGAETLGFP